MRFRLPEPLHGWRQFSGEVGIIVLGVLIALGAGQIADAVRWRQEARQALDAIDLEMAHDAGVFDERTLVQPCLNKRLAELDSMVRVARQTGVLPRISEIGGPPWRPLETSAWSSALSGGMLEHFGADTRDVLSNFQAQLAGTEQSLDTEDEMWASLGVIVNAPGRVSDGILADASETIARLHYRTRFNGSNASQQLEKIVEGLRLAPRYDIVLDTNGPRKDVMTSVARAAICRTLMVDGKPYSNAFQRNP